MSDWQETIDTLDEMFPDDAGQTPGSGNPDAPMPDEQAPAGDADWQETIDTLDEMFPDEPGEAGPPAGTQPAPSTPQTPPARPSKGPERITVRGITYHRQEGGGYDATGFETHAALDSLPWRGEGHDRYLAARDEGKGWVTVPTITPEGRLGPEGAIEYWSEHDPSRLVFHKTPDEAEEEKRKTEAQYRQFLKEGRQRYGPPAPPNPSRYAFLVPPQYILQTPHMQRVYGEPRGGGPEWASNRRQMDADYNAAIEQHAEKMAYREWGTVRPLSRGRWGKIFAKHVPEGLRGDTAYTQYALDVQAAAEKQGLRFIAPWERDYAQKGFEHIRDDGARRAVRDKLQEFTREAFNELTALELGSGDLEIYDGAVTMPRATFEKIVGSVQRAVVEAQRQEGGPWAHINAAVAAPAIMLTLMELTPPKDPREQERWRLRQQWRQQGPVDLREYLAEHKDLAEFLPLGGKVIAAQKDSKMRRALKTLVESQESGDTERLSKRFERILEVEARRAWGPDVQPEEHINVLRMDYYAGNLGDAWPKSQEAIGFGLARNYVHQRLMEMEELQIRGRTAGSRIGEGIIESLSWMAEFAMLGGAGQGAASGISGLLAVGKRWGTKTAFRLLARQLKRMVLRTLVQGATVSAHRLAGYYGAQRLPRFVRHRDGTVEVTDWGDPVALALSKAATQHFVELMSEQLGSYVGLGSVTEATAGKLKWTQGAKKAILRLWQKRAPHILQRLGDGLSGPALKRLRDLVAFDGTLDELSEEALAQMGSWLASEGMGGRAMADGPLWSGQEFLEMVAVLAVPGGAMRVGGAALDVSGYAAPAARRGRLVQALQERMRAMEAAEALGPEAITEAVKAGRVREIDGDTVERPIATSEDVARAVSLGIVSADQVEAARQGTTEDARALLQRVRGGLDALDAQQERARELQAEQEAAPQPEAPPEAAAEQEAAPERAERAPERPETAQEGAAERPEATEIEEATEGPPPAEEGVAEATEAAEGRAVPVPERYEVRGQRDVAEWQERRRYKRGNREQVEAAALTAARESGEPRYIYATNEGLTVDTDPPPSGQSYDVATVDAEGRGRITSLRRTFPVGKPIPPAQDRAAEEAEAAPVAEEVTPEGREARAAGAFEQLRLDAVEAAGEDTEARRVAESMRTVEAQTPQQEAVRDMADEMGFDLRFYETDAETAEQEPAGGVQNGVLFVSTKAADGQVIAGHGVYHAVRQAGVDTGALDAAIEAVAEGSPDDYVNEQDPGPFHRNLTDAELREEWYADRFGELVQTPEFWQKLRGENAPLHQKVLDAVRQLVDRAKAVFRKAGAELPAYWQRMDQAVQRAVEAVREARPQARETERGERAAEVREANRERIEELEREQGSLFGREDQAPDLPDELTDIADEESDQLMAAGEQGTFAQIPSEPGQAPTPETDMAPESEQVPANELLSGESPKFFGRLLHGVQMHMDAFLSIVAPTMRGKEAKKAARVLRKHFAQRERNVLIAQESTRLLSKMFRFMPRADVKAFLAATENPDAREFSDPNMQKAVEFFREFWTRKRKQLVDEGLLDSWYELYFPHIFKDPEGVKRWYRGGGGSLAGSQSFRKQRTYPTWQDALDAGFEPVTWNPVTLNLLKVHEVERARAGHRIKKEMNLRGMVRFRYARSAQQEGYTDIEDPLFRVDMPPEMTIKEAYDRTLVQNLTALLSQLGVKHKRLEAIGKGAWGRTEGESEITTRFAGPEFVLLHELGHIIGNRYDLYEWMLRDSGDRAQIKRELDALASARYEGTEDTVSDKFKEHVRQSPEEEAVITQAFVYAPEKMQEVAPTVKAKFEQFLQNNKELSPILDMQRGLVLAEHEGTVRVPGITTIGHYEAPDTIATLINNHLQPGLRKSPNKFISGTYDMLRKGGNLMIQFQHGLSTFHARFIALTAISNEVSLALRELVGKPGTQVKGLKRLLKSPLAPVRYVVQGAKLRKALKQPLDQIGDPRMREMVGAVIESGGRSQLPAFYYNQALRGLQETMEEFINGPLNEQINAAGKGPLKAVGAAMEAVNAPIMQWLVPNVKVGAFMELAKHEMEMLHTRDVADERLKARLTHVWDRVDGRFGQLVYDNLFWNRTLRDTLMLALRSVGWNFGELREYAGVATDIWETRARMRGGDVWLSHRMAHLIAEVFVFGIMGAVRQYLYTGEPPEEPMDLLYPRTGRVRPDGSPERLFPISYAKDWWAWYDHPTEAIGHKLHPALNLLYHAARNEDFFGTEIRHPGDPVFDQMQDLAKYAGKQWLPFSVRNVERLERSGHTRMEAVVMSGLSELPAPAAICRTPAQAQMMQHIVGRLPRGKRTTEQFESAQARKEVIRDLRAGKDVDWDAIKEKYSGEEIGRMIDASEDPWVVNLFERLRFDEALNVYAVANERERELWKPILVGKYRRADRTDRHFGERQEMMRELFAGEEGVDVGESVSMEEELRKSQEAYIARETYSLSATPADALRRREGESEADFEARRKRRADKIESALYAVEKMGLSSDDIINAFVGGVRAGNINLKVGSKAFHRRKDRLIAVGRSIGGTQEQ